MNPPMPSSTFQTPICLLLREESLVNIRKPDRAIFELAASKVGIGVELSQILFVGDNPSADIVGTQTAGMKTAWVSGGREWPLADASPDFIVETVADLARLMA